MDPIRLRTTATALRLRTRPDVATDSDNAGAADLRADGRRKRVAVIINRSEADGAR